MTNYFKKSEFACPCCGENLISDTLISVLNQARANAGVPFVINSGYRCKVHNAQVGGEPNSAHTRGLAADIRVDSDAHRFAIFSALQKVGFKRIGIYKTWIHCDIDQSLTQNVIWYK